MYKRNHKTNIHDTNQYGAEGHRREKIKNCVTGSEPVYNKYTSFLHACMFVGCDTQLKPNHYSNIRFKIHSSHCIDNL